MTQYQRIALASRPNGEPTLDNFRYETAELPPLSAGEVLVRVIWQSLDPYMRGRMDASKSYAAAVEVGGTMEAGGVGEVIETQSDRYAVGDIVVGRTGWASHAILAQDEVRRVDPELAPTA